MFPEIDGQLAWDPKKNEVQYIISWSDHGSQSERVTSMYGNIEVVSDGHASNVAVFTERIAANNSKTIQHPNGKFTIEIPEEATAGDQDIYFALSSGYDINPPDGKVFMAGGVAYNTTALKLGDNEEVSELPPHVFMRFSYAADTDVSTLEVCHLNGIDKWMPVSSDKVTFSKGIAELKTLQLGAYALMMRKEDPLAEAVKAVQDATKAIETYTALVASNDSNGSVYPANTPTA